jgi:hypothetical protein
MKAQLKVNYSEAVKGQIFKIVEIQGKRITLDVNGRNVDFGFSEVQIVAPSKSDMFNLGRKLMQIQTYGFVMRDNDINEAFKTINLPIKKSLAVKSISDFIYA